MKGKYDRKIDEDERGDEHNGDEEKDDGEKDDE